MSRQLRQQPYDAYAAGYATRLDPTLAGASARLTELAGARPGMRLLDVATGTGTATRAAARRGASVVGVDRSPGMLAVASELSPELDFRRADARALPFKDGSFDAVTCGLAVSHFADRDRALREILRVLGPAGRFVASAWGEGSRFPDDGIDELLDRYGAPAPSEALDEATWQSPERGGSVLRRAGFANVSFRSESFDGNFADADEALAWSLGWPLIASRLERLDSARRERFRRESLQILAGSRLSWRFVFNFYLANKSGSA
jgi:SAM-dependent methyltransferase